MNTSKPPDEWQTYDILFVPPHWNDADELAKRATITILYNAAVGQNRYELTAITGGIKREVSWKASSKYGAPHPPEVFLELQHHNNPVRFRNISIWPTGQKQRTEPGSEEAVRFFATEYIELMQALHTVLPMKSI